MGMLRTLATLPVSGTVLGLGWLARRIAEAAEREMNDPARIEAALLALNRALEAGDLSEPEFEAREAALLEELERLAAPQDAAPDAAPGAAPAAPLDSVTPPLAAS